MNIRQKLLAKKLVENHGNVSKSMREVGYSKGYSKNPQEMKRTKSWTELLEDDLPDALLTSMHRKLLKKKKYVIVEDNEGNKTAIATNEIDESAVSKGLDMAFKLKGKYAPEKHKIAFEELDKMDDDELAKTAGYTLDRPTNSTEGSSVPEEIPKI